MADERDTQKSFGQRAPQEPAPAVTPPDPTAIKRSRSLSLGLLATSGIAVIGFNTFAWPEVDEVLVYPDAAACAAEAIRTPDDCRSAFTIARAAYPGTAPHYDGLPACERHHGTGHCLTDPGAGASPQFVPRMAGYLLARNPGQAVNPQPVYEHDGGGGHHGYCTGSGAKIAKGSGGSASSGKVKSAAVSGTRFGGFGSSGRGFFGSGG